MRQTQSIPTVRMDSPAGSCSWPLLTCSTLDDAQKTAILSGETISVQSTDRDGLPYTYTCRLGKPAQVGAMFNGHRLGARGLETSYDYGDSDAVGSVGSDRSDNTPWQKGDDINEEE